MTSGMDWWTVFFCVIFGVVVVFILVREFMCWYWKLNRIVELLESIDKKLNGAVVEDHNEEDNSSV